VQRGHHFYVWSKVRSAMMYYLDLFIAILFSVQYYVRLVADLQD
jgi:hypothetical protein